MSHAWQHRLLPEIIARDTKMGPPHLQQNMFSLEFVSSNEHATIAKEQG
jgi:hypothetical protein